MSRGSSARRPWRTALVLFAAAAALALFFWALPTPEAGAEAGAEAEKEPESFAVRSVRIFDGEKTIPSGTVLVRGERIAAVGAEVAIPEGVEIVEGEGKTLLPGLIDAHTHNWGASLERALQFGVTTQIDMFSEPGWAASMRAEQAAGPVAHRADLFSAGVLATAPRGHGTQFGIPIPTLEEPGDAEAFVAARVAEGSDFLKIVTEDGSTIGAEIPTLGRETLGALVRAAHARDKLAVVHIHTLETALQAFEEGADGLVHLFLDRPPTEKLLELAAGRFVIPTLTVLESATGTASGATLAEGSPFTSYLLPSEAQNLERSFPKREGSPNRYAYAEETVAWLASAGVPILAGSDAPNPGTAHGASLHRELELLVAAGLSPAEALAAATSRPALAFGLADRGRIAPGLRADLLLVEGDPTREITATRRVAAVWKAGARVERRIHEQDAEKIRASALPAGSLLIAGFDSGEMDAAVGFGWQGSDDRMMPDGASTVELEVTEPGAAGTAGALAVRGEIREGYPYPWAGAMYFPGEMPMASANLANHTAVAFQVRGGGGPYRLMAFSERGGQFPSWTTFEVGEEWREVVVPFSALDLDASGLRALLFTGGPGPGAFHFEIDQVEIR